MSPDDENLRPPPRTPPPLLLWPWEKAPPLHRQRWEAMGIEKTPDFVVVLPPVLAPWREQILRWFADGIQGTTIHAALVRNHGFTGSYSAVRRFLQAHAAAQPPDATMRLCFAPGDAAHGAQVTRDGDDRHPTAPSPAGTGNAGTLARAGTSVGRGSSAASECLRG